MREAFESKDRQIESLQIDEVQVRTFGGCAMAATPYGHSDKNDRIAGGKLAEMLRHNPLKGIEMRGRSVRKEKP